MLVLHLQGSAKPSHRRTASSPVCHDFLRGSVYSSGGPFGVLGDSSNGLSSPRCACIDYYYWYSVVCHDAFRCVFVWSMLRSCSNLLIRVWNRVFGLMMWRAAVTSTLDEGGEKHLTVREVSAGLVKSIAKQENRLRYNSTVVLPKPAAVLTFGATKKLQSWRATSTKQRLLISISRKTAITYRPSHGHGGGSPS